jgi:hypothetical protein
MSYLKKLYKLNLLLSTIFISGCAGLNLPAECKNGNDEACVELDIIEISERDNSEDYLSLSRTYDQCRSKKYIHLCTELGDKLRYAGKKDSARRLYNFACDNGYSPGCMILEEEQKAKERKKLCKDGLTLGQFLGSNPYMLEGKCMWQGFKIVQQLSKNTALGYIVVKKYTKYYEPYYDINRDRPVIIEADESNAMYLSDGSTIQGMFVVQGANNEVMSNGETKTVVRLKWSKKD